MYHCFHIKGALGNSDSFFRQTRWEQFARFVANRSVVILNVIFLKMKGLSFQGTKRNRSKFYKIHGN